MAVVRKKLEGVWAAVVVDFVCADFALPFTEDVVAAAGFLPEDSAGVVLGVTLTTGEDCGLEGERE